MAQEAQLTESSVWNSQEYSQSFFASYPSDNRFLSTSFQKFGPSTAIDGI